MYTRYDILSSFLCLMKKRLIWLWLIVFLVWWVYLYVSRPLPFEVVDPGHEYFTLPKWEKRWGVRQIERIFPESDESLVRIRLFDGQVNDRGHVITNQSWVVVRVDEKAIELLITKEIRNRVSEKVRSLNGVLSNHGFFVQNWLTHTEAISKMYWVQYWTRSIGAIAVVDCLNAKSKGKSTSCLSDLWVFLRFGRELQYGGTMTQMLIGLSIEKTALEYIAYIKKHNSDATSSLHRYFASHTFPDTKTVCQTAIKQEYHLINNLIEKIEKLEKGKKREELYINAPHWYVRLLLRIIPNDLVWNAKETQKLARHLFKSVHEWEYDSIEAFINDTHIRKNMLGNIALSRLIPQIEWICERVQNTHNRNEFINH